MGQAARPGQGRAAIANGVILATAVKPADLQEHGCVEPPWQRSRGKGTLAPLDIDELRPPARRGRPASLGQLSICVETRYALGKLYDSSRQGHPRRDLRSGGDFREAAASHAVVTRALEPALVASLFVGASATAFCFAGLGMPAGALVPDRRVAAGTALARVLGSYFLGIISATASS